MSVVAIARKDVGLHCYKRTPVQILSGAAKQKRLDRAKAFIRRFSSQRVKRVFFTDEKAFHIDPSMNRQNNRLWATSKKKQVATKRLLVQRAKFSPRIMVSAGVCFGGKGRLHFIPEQAKVNATYYTQHLLPMLKEDCLNLL